MYFYPLLLFSFLLYLPSSPHPFHCTSDSDCFPTLNSNLSSCLNSFCICRDCLSTNALVNSCVLDRCFIIINDSCLPSSNHHLKSIALLYAVFLTGVGASNFYLQLWIPGSIQLSITLLLWTIVFMHTIWDLILFTLVKKKKLRGGFFVPCSIISTIVFIIIVALLCVFIVIWWFVDVISLATDSRKNMDGCHPL